MQNVTEQLLDVYKAQDWIRSVSDNGGWKVEAKSLAAMRATLKFLRKKLPDETSTCLGDQLPPMIREMYYKESPYSDPTMRKQDSEGFLETIQEYLKPRTDIEPEEAAYAVFKTLAHKVAPEIIQKIKPKLPLNMQPFLE